jgi:hypothetical protein
MLTMIRAPENCPANDRTDSANKWTIVKKDGVGLMGTWIWRLDIASLLLRASSTARLASRIEFTRESKACV